MIKCISCKSRISLTDIIDSTLVNCRRCGSKLEINYFPSLFTSLNKGEKAAAILSDEEASCFNHPEKKASALCSSCGIYICNLCELNIHDKHFCPNCFNNNTTEKEINPFIKNPVLYSNVAISIVIIGFLTGVGFFATGPYVVYYGYKHFKKEESLIKGRSPIKFGIAIFLAIVQIILTIVIIINIIMDLN
ncbi:MAG: hypothetical protein COA79_02740 [Planctomycetota bacterium]|nr:MAG: hypothetical protein COA79_02740 [Planctomycetota bacterium]